MKLFLEDGTAIEGGSFGAKLKTPAFGEVVFNTGMVGYVESLTDPSYAGQILVLTYPLVGNYGVPDKKFFESSKIHVSGLIVSEYSEAYSSHTAKESLAEWLKASGVPAMTGVDTRALTKKLREHGVMLGALSEKAKPRKFEDPNQRNLVAEVSVDKKKTYEPEGKPVATIVAVDCGMKENIVRSFLTRNVRVIRVPWDYDFSSEEYDGLFISNGPGDPTMCAATIKNLQGSLKGAKPILGICLGTQLLALASGAKTYKLKYGHRSQNQPCTVVESGRCFITSQNHGFAVDAKTLPKEWGVWFTNLNDGSVEGIRHKTKSIRATQFHPEAAPGPTDTAWVFDEFIVEMKKHKKKHD
ncbi:MAG: glutamine-hydrolyzing carbamoyl-phosphate synthase small subunit [Patescibacteria group bacterium]|nr:glutamine-hydrolyzing carbamoyl-phosphate synthase small subunit [Patescibacteria group bacterium]